MKNPNRFYVYEHHRPDRDECFYVGKGCGNRANDMHWGRNRWHKFIQAKLKSLNLPVVVRLIADGLSEREAFDLEIERIAMWRADGLDLANITNGGDGPTGRKNSPETIERMKASALKRNSNLAYREKLSIATKKSWEGNEKRREDIRKIGESRKGIKTGPPSEETRKKISDGNKGKKIPPHQIDILRRRGLENRESFKLITAMGTESVKRKVICITDNLEFESASAAARHYGALPSNVIEMCSGNGRRKTVKGCVFQYLDTK